MKPSELKVGTVFYECQSGFNLKAITTTEPVRSIDIWNGEEKVRWSWIAVNAFTGVEIPYSLVEGFEHYGPRIYNEPQYAYVKDGEFCFKFIGEDDERT
jgi:hypothetical protein